MKKKLITLLIFAISLTNYAQIKFEKGYFINNANKKIACFIKNIDWRNNPTAFEYKLSNNEKPKIGNIINVKEFGVYGYSKYKRFVVDIDRSSNKLSELSNIRTLSFKEETIFLKVLIEGDADLFLYENNSLRRYFYKTKKIKIEQLAFKQFYNKDGDIQKNERFKQQLWINLTCDGVSKKGIQNMGYNEVDLTKLFSRYNQCSDKNYVNKDTQKKRDLFNLTLRPGISQTKLLIDNLTYISNFYDRVEFFKTEFDNKFVFRFGIEAEFIMPFNKNKWAIFIEPTYKSYKTEKKQNQQINLIETRVKNVKVDYKYIELPIGVRYYFFLNKKSKIFINGAYVINHSINSVIDDDTLYTFNIKANANFVFGLGYNYNNKFSLEIRAATNRGLLRDNLSWYTKYKSTSIIVGYTIF